MRRIGKVKERKRKIGKVRERKRKNSGNVVSGLWSQCPTIERF